jgi:hypothetical protein
MGSAMKFSDILYNLTTDNSSWLVQQYIAWTLTRLFTTKKTFTCPLFSVAYPRIFFGEGGYVRTLCSGEVQQIQWRTEGRENGDLGAVAP